MRVVTPEMRRASTIAWVAELLLAASCCMMAANSLTFESVGQSIERVG
jgi:hypothetical protein